MRGKKILYLVLVLSILISTLGFTSCNRKYDENEVISAAEALLKESEILNFVLFGKGIDCVYSNHQNGAYYESNSLHLRELGFSTIDELRVLIGKTFTEEYAENINSTVLSPIISDGINYSMTRYYQLYDDPVSKTDPICIMVYKDYNYLFRDSVEYKLDTIKVEGVKKQTLFLSVMATVTNDKGESQERKIEFELIEESEGWRINTPTYANYNSHIDEYDNLKDQEIK